jgi:hypothetical protein
MMSSICVRGGFATPALRALPRFARALNSGYVALLRFAQIAFCNFIYPQNVSRARKSSLSWSAAISFSQGACVTPVRR